MINNNIRKKPPTAKDKRRMSEGKSVSWRSRVCDEGKSASWRSRVCDER